MSKHLSFFFFFAVGNLQNAPSQIFFMGIFCYAPIQNALIYKETIPSFAQRRLQVLRASQKELFCLAGRITRVALNEQAFKLYLFFAEGNLQNAQSQLFFKSIFCYASFQNALSKNNHLPFFACLSLQSIVDKRKTDRITNGICFAAFRRLGYTKPCSG